MSVYQIGRSAKCDIIVADKSVSRIHAELEPLEMGRFRLVDCGSTYGTFVQRAGEWHKVRETTISPETPIAFGSYKTSAAALLDLTLEPNEAASPRKKTEGPSIIRRLAAILAADVVGYSSLMEKNESGTLTALKACRREVFDPAVERWRGRIFKLIGDGILVEFPSVVDGVRCALEIQTSMKNRGFEPLQPGELNFRIGLNLGDVICEGDDMYGNGVNIAARLESMADPGGLCVSGPVHDQISYAMDLGFTDLGEQTVKNITQPIRVFKVHSTASGRVFPASFDRT